MHIYIYADASGTMFDIRGWARFVFWGARKERLDRLPIEARIPQVSGQGLGFMTESFGFSKRLELGLEGC